MSSGPETPSQQPQVMDTQSARYQKEHDRIVGESKAKIQARRLLARITITDMERLLSAWQENSLVPHTLISGGNPLQITLNEKQIEAIAQEYRRLSYIVQDVQRSAIDHEMFNAENPPSAARGMIAEEFGNKML